MYDDNYVQVQRKGIVVIEPKSGKKYIHDVMRVPNLAQNLLSLGQRITNASTQS